MYTNKEIMDTFKLSSIKLKVISCFNIILRFPANVFFLNGFEII